MEGSSTPPGQKYIPKFIIYAEFGIPKIDLESYRLIVEGLVEKRLELTYDELKLMIDTEYVSDFHCVTGWSIKDVRWRGISFSRIIDRAKPLPEARYVYAVSLDGYTTTIDLEDLKNDKAIIVLEINDKPLSVEQGFPARLFVPHLYGWKSAKWLHKIIFIDRYIDGYWEERGYHERGRVWEEERFKDYIGKHKTRKIVGLQNI
jgi:DMSO/TMAO reductase YedYZ molybdopterin-dependent catalytic subunit